MTRSLAFFPMPYPNEDIRSIIHRYHIRSGETSFIKTSKVLFDTYSLKNNYVSQNILFFINKLNNKDIDIDYLLEKHTLYPLIRPFLSETRNKEFHESVNIIGTLENQKIWSNNINQSIQYCPDCIEEDYCKYGEPYAHRLHQLNIIDYCYRHYSKLIAICEICSSPLSKNNNSTMLRSIFCENGHNLTEQKTAKIMENSFSKEFLDEILYIEENSKNLNRGLVTDLFYVALANADYINCKAGTVNRGKLRENFQLFLDEQQVKLNYKSQVNIAKEKFSIILSKKNNIAPDLLIYLLLIKFLSKSAKDFFEPKSSFSVSIPFGNEPQPCLNKLCNYYEKVIIEMYKKTYYSWYVKGEFQCPHCGYTYACKWIWSKNGRSGAIQKPFIISRGELWKRKVMALYEQGYSIRDIANLIEEYGDPIKEFLKETLGNEDYNERFNPKNNTLYKHILREKGLKSINYSKKVTLYQRRLLVRRQQILGIIQENPSLSRQKIKVKARADYIWLMKYDRVWMNENLPKPFNK